MCSLYGTEYATIYECLSSWSNGPRNMIKTLFHFLFQAALVLGALIFLVMQPITKSIGWVFMTAKATPNWLIRRSVSIFESVVSLDAFGFAFLLQWKTWAIAIPACWMLYLEIRQMATG